MESKPKIFGERLEFIRNSNKLYTQLDDLDWVYSELKVMSMAQFAEKHKVPYNSVRHRVHKYFPPEWLSSIKRQRRFHTNNTGKIKLQDGDQTDNGNS